MIARLHCMASLAVCCIYMAQHRKIGAWVVKVFIIYPLRIASIESAAAPINHINKQSSPKEQGKGILTLIAGKQTHLRPIQQPYTLPQFSSSPDTHPSPLYIPSSYPPMARYPLSTPHSDAQSALRVSASPCPLSAYPLQAAHPLFFEYPPTI